MQSHVCGAVRYAYAMPVYILFVSSSGAIIDHSQSTKDIDPYFKSKLYVEDPEHRKLILIFTEWAEEIQRASARLQF